MNVLIVDDFAAFRMTLKTVITSVGYTVVLAADGVEALKKIAIVPADIVITDIHMPNMDGINLRDKLRMIPDKAQIPVLFVSGVDDEITAQAVVNTELEGLYLKGRRISEILAWVQYLTTPVCNRSPMPPSYDARIKMS